MQDHNNHNKWLQGIGENYLSLRNTICLKGILSVCIIFCHLWGAVSLGHPQLSEGIIGHTIGRICTVLGYLSVALFFFLSGVIIKSHTSKVPLVGINKAFNCCTNVDLPLPV